MFTWGHVDYQIVQFLPVGLKQQLQHHAADHRPAHNRFSLVREAEGHGLYPLVLNRDYLLGSSLGRLQLTVFPIYQSWQRRTVYVCIENSHFFTRLEIGFFTFCNAKAKLIATVLLPTPPLQLETAIIFFTFCKPPFFMNLASFSLFGIYTFGAILISRFEIHEIGFNWSSQSDFIFLKLLSSFKNIMTSFYSVT